MNNIWDLFAIPIVFGIFAFIGVGWNTFKVIWSVYFPPRTSPVEINKNEYKP